MARIVVDMNQIVEDTRVVRILRVDLVEELCRESLPLEALTAFLDRYQKLWSSARARSKSAETSGEHEVSMCAWPRPAIGRSEAGVDCA